MRLSLRETSWLLIIMICAKVFFTDVTIFIHNSATGAHLQVIWCSVIEIALFILVWKLFKNLNETNLFDCTKKALGKTGLVFTGIVLFTLQSLNISSMLNMYSETMSSLTLPSSPVWVTTLFIILSMVVCVIFKPRGFIGIASAFGIVIAVLFFAIILLDVNHYDYTNIFPITGTGFKDILKGISGISVFSEILFLFYISDNLKDKSTVWRTGIIVLSVSALITYITTLAYTFAIPYPVSLKFYMPLFQISSDITTDVVIQRAEALFLIMWIISTFVYMGASFYFLTKTFEGFFMSSDNRAIAPISLVLIIIISGLFQNINSASKFLSTLKNINSVFVYILLITVFGICAIKKRRERKND